VGTLTPYHTSEFSDWKVSHHASKRWCERIGMTNDTWAARRLIIFALENGITIPNRLAAQQWVIDVEAARTTLSRRNGIRYHVAGSALLITAGNRVVTVIKLTDEDIAIVLTWLTSGFWIEK